MTSPYLELVQTHAALLQRHDLPLLETLRGRELPPRAEPAADAPVALLLSPHPDDECIPALWRCGSRASAVIAS